MLFKIAGLVVEGSQYDVYTNMDVSRCCAYNIGLSMCSMHTKFEGREQLWGGGGVPTRRVLLY